MIVILECSDIAQRMSAYVDRRLEKSEQAAFDTHLATCKRCRQQVKQFRTVHGMMENTFNQADAPSRDLAEKTSKWLEAVSPENIMGYVESRTETEAEPSFADSLRDRFGAAPWWGVSVAMHVLAILLAGLVSMAVELPKTDDSVVMVTELQPRKELKAEEPEKAKTDTRSALESKQETPPTDPTSKDLSDIVVPPDILAKAELGDHFETINLDRPDTQSAFGNPDAHMFHSVQGNDEPEGGGGMNGSSLDDLIGVGGAASPGSGGGWGGGHGTGIGVGNGAGRGSFGNRNGGGRRLMVKRHGGSKATESSVDKGLAWLARHQEPDGSWAAEKYADNLQGRWGWSNTTVKANTVGVSGLATLAFLGAGHSTRVGLYKENVKRCVTWLIKNQAADGHLAGSGCTISTSYCHHIATLALCEAYAMSGSRPTGSYGDPGMVGGNEDLKKAVEKALELIYKWQDANPQGGWSYEANSPIDPTVSGWAIMALKGAKVAGFKIPAERFLKGLDAIRSITTLDKTKGDYGHAMTGYRAQNAQLFNSKGYATTAAGLVSNLFLGMTTADPLVNAAASYITQDEALPNWNFTPADSATDYQNIYYWYYGTLGTFQAGGDYWPKWNKRLQAALLPNQRKGGALDGSPTDVDGSWNPDDVWGAWGGRVYSTALSTLCLEVYYRYVKLHN